MAASGALGATFKITRLMQGASLIAIIGMTSNFISDMISAKVEPPTVLIGTISVACTSVLYCAITVILFLDDLLPFLINAILDTLFLVAAVVVAVVVGKPLAYADCKAIGQVSGSAASAFDLTNALSGSLNENGGKIDYSSWIGINKSTCLEMKSIWGLSIALCILFAFSAISSICLWRRNNTATPVKAEA